MKKISILISVSTFIIGLILGFLFDYSSNNQESKSQTNTDFPISFIETPDIANRNPTNQPEIIVSNETEKKPSTTQSLSVTILERTQEGFTVTSNNQNSLKIIVSEKTEVIGEYQSSAAINYATVICKSLNDQICDADFILISPVG